MRTLTSTLTAAQKSDSYKGLVKIVLTFSGETTQTYTSSRILDVKFHEEPDKQTAEVTLDNSDGTLTDIDFKGYKAVISGGATTSAGDEYSPKPPVWVVGQQLLSWQGRLACKLSMAGIMNFLESERASAVYAPDSDDTDTVKTILTAIVEATLSCFSHAHAFTITFDSEDSLIDSFQPKDSFSIGKNQTRLSAMKKLLSYTQCVMRAEDDGEIHIFTPTTTGASYNYEYELGSGNHAFFSLSHRKRLVIPYYIQVDSSPSHGDGYTGYAEDTDTASLVATDSTIGQREYHELRLASDSQAADVATAILSHYQMEAEKGAASIPVNFGAEVFDYVNCIDSRDNDNSRVGNIGYIKTHYSSSGRSSYSSGSWGMYFGFGKIGFGLAGTALPLLSSDVSTGGGGGVGGGGLSLSEIMPILEYMMSLINQVIAYLEAVDPTNPFKGYIWIDSSGNIHIRPKNGQNIKVYEDVDPHLTNDASFGSSSIEYLDGFIKKSYHDTRLQIPVGTDMYD